MLPSERKRLINAKNHCNLISTGSCIKEEEAHTKRDAGDGVIKLYDGFAVGSQFWLVVTTDASKQVLVLDVDVAQRLGQVTVVDLLESLAQVHI
jgi:hypothetical protein